MTSVKVPIATAGEGIEGFDVLVDTRHVTRGTALTASELWQLADQLVHYRKTFAHKTAIVCPQERFGRSAFFALCAQNRGFNIQAFTDYGDAMDWLSAMTPPRPWRRARSAIPARILPRCDSGSLGATATCGRAEAFHFRGNRAGGRLRDARSARYI